MPNRSAHTQTGNFRARYAAEFDDPTGVEYRIEFIDNDTSTTARVAFGQTSAETPHEIPVTADGFVLSYDGPTDHIGAAIIPSKCTTTFVIENSDHELLTPEIRDGDDGRFGLAIYKSDGVDWVPFWVGGLNHEAIEYELQDQRYLVTLSASCGLNRLRDIAFRKDDGSAYTDKETIANLVAICLNKIPFANFWLNADNQLAEVVDCFNDEGQTGWSPSAGDPFPFSVAERTMTFASGFYEVNDPQKDIYNRRIYRGPNFMTCMDVLESISVAFGYRIFQSETLFWLFPANAYNWSHTLRVHKWTRSQVATETIELAIPGGGTTYDETSTTTDVNFRVDLDTNHGLVNGFAHSYLVPVHDCVITHLNGGRQSAFGSPFSHAIDYPTAGPQVFTSTDTVLQDGEYITVRGNYFSQPLLTQFGIGEPSQTDRIGARIVLRFKIKAGSYYYGSEYSVDTETTNIDMPFGFSDLSFKRLFLDTAQWSTDEKFFDVIVPWTNSSPAADVESSQGWDRVGGLHIDATGNGEFEYSASTQWGAVSHPINFTTAPLPDTVSTYSGLEVELDRIIVTRAGVAFDHFDHLTERFFATGVSVDYDQDGNSVSPNVTAPIDLVTDFQVLIGGTDEDSDIVYTASQTNQIESFDMGQTLLGDSNIDGEASTRACFFILQPGQTERTSQNLSNFDWQSITDSVDQNDDPDGLLEVRARETLFARSKPRPTQRGQVAVSYNATDVDPLHMTNVWHHNCSTVGNSIDYLVPFRFEWNAGFGTFDADLCLIRRQRVGFVNDTDKIIKNPPIDTDGGIGPGDTSGDTGLSKVLQVVENVYNDHEAELSNLDTRITSNDTDITNITQRIQYAIPTDYKTTPQIQVSSKNTNPSNGTIGATSNGVFLTAPDDMSTTLVLELPSADGTSGQALTTDGSGVLSFSTVSGGGGGSSDVYAFLECSSNIGLSNSYRYLPIGGNYVDTGGVGSLGAQNGAIVYNTFVFPFAGELDRVVLRCENAPGSMTIRVLKNGSSAYTATASQSSADTAEVITFSGATFAAGDGINIAVSFQSVPADVFAVVVLKMTP